MKRNKIHRFLAILIELNNGQKKWYRASPKIYQAMLWEAKRSNKMPLAKLRDCYINVPKSDYFRNTGKAGIGVGRICYLKFKKMSADELCTRSQFITTSALKDNWHQCYHYLRHDYGKYSHLQIYVDLYNWHRKLMNKQL